MLAGQSGAHSFPWMCKECVLRFNASVTAIADKLGLEFALFHRKRDGKSEDAPEKLELLVGDVKDKVSVLYVHSNPLHLISGLRI